MKTNAPMAPHGMRTMGMKTPKSGIRAPRVNEHSTGVPPLSGAPASSTGQLGASPMSTPGVFPPSGFPPVGFTGRGRKG